MVSVEDGPLLVNVVEAVSSSNPSDAVIFVGISLALGIASRHLLRGTRVPYTVALLIIGIGLGSLEYGTKHRLGKIGNGIRLWANIDPDLLLAVFLPALLFESSFSMEVHQIKRCMVQMILLAGPGVIISTFCLGSALKLTFPYGWSWKTSLLLGGLLSATDPVAVVALLKDLGASKKLSTIIEGESLMNDGTAIVVYQLLFRMAFGQSFNWDGVLKFLAQVSIGAVGIGLAFGIASVLWLGFIFNDTVIEITLTVAVSYIAYFTAQEGVDDSGVLTVMTLGMFYASVARTAFKGDGQQSLHHFWEMVSYIANTLIFILSGVVIAEGVLSNDIVFENHGTSWGFLILLFVFVQISRVMVVGVLYPFLRISGYGLDWKEAIILVWSGLRGAVALSLSLSVKVKDLLSKIEEHSNFYIVVDTDVLLEKDLVTLDEALKSANTAVLMAINTISILISESQKKLQDLPGNDVEELKLPELNEILESYEGARIGFGSGYNIQTSIMRAVYDCPFLSDGIEDINGIVICIITSSDVADVSNVDAFLHTLRIITNYNGKVVLSVVHESNLESNLIRTTIITAGYAKEQVPQEKSIFSRLVHHFPFISNLLRRHIPQSSVSQDSYAPESSSFSLVADTLDPDEILEVSPTDVTSEVFGIYSAELESILSSNDDEVHDSRGYDSGSDQRKVDRSETISDSLNYNDPDTEGRNDYLLSRVSLLVGISSGKNIGSQSIPMMQQRMVKPIQFSIHKLPVGVKQSEEFKNSPTITNVIQHEENIVNNDVRSRIPLTRRMSLDAPDDVGLGISSEFNDGASAKWKGNDNNVSKKQGVLSARAASMLESERASQKKWNPIVEMNYIQGVAREGRLLLSDGSIYEGLWRYGKRSGLGTFHFSNGDVFQGLWRDDVMHGKGWLYFHSGDRWFANFWKGKANGEGRFYSSRGDIFFGHFKDGWRCDHFLCINVDGTRYLEHWDEGVLLSRKQLEAEYNSSA